LAQVASVFLKRGMYSVGVDGKASQARSHGSRQALFGTTYDPSG
jgi:hypothetical protein